MGRSERGDVRSLRALLALLDVERDPLAFIERAVPAGLDGRVVDEDVRSATVGGGEAEPLLSVEPLHCSFGHCSLLAVVAHRGPAIAQGLPDGPTLAVDHPWGTGARRFVTCSSSRTRPMTSPREHGCPVEPAPETVAHGGPLG